MRKEMKNIEKPDFQSIWETYIKIGLPDVDIHARVQKTVQMIKSEVSDTVSKLTEKGIIDWYQFLVHPNPRDGSDKNWYFHILFNVKKNITNSQDLDLPSYCIKELTGRVCERDPIYFNKIAGISDFLLENHDIGLAWKLIGEQSEWLIKMINIYKDVIPIEPDIVQFYHFYLNMLGLPNHKLLLF
jgi:hypothetical protein